MENRLFRGEFQKLELEDTTLLYFPQFLDNNEADFWFENLNSTILFQSGEIKLFGKTFKKPRLEAFFADGNLSYSYSGQQLNTQRITDELNELKTRVESVSQLDFNAILVNLYRDGQDSNGWHADNEKELGSDPLIASVSLGAERIFEMQHIHSKKRIKLNLEHGSLLFMLQGSQRFWKHQLPKDKSVHLPRINLTFRKIFT
ncbi:MAG: alpha-ketoglutarate-dependent dioxygenase AlkB [Crocinitomicaceae bacterium]|nr:alpha-ketoglutarate-dependent dioxygenase AlkB [Crocinitomicaceae bacterium]MCF8443538.1 alpha-ketoglutarate-dependent dioxygenase AlkB [Crocinitomicaceae bacterium]